MGPKGGKCENVFCFLKISFSMDSMWIFIGYDRLCGESDICKKLVDCWIKVGAVILDIRSKFDMYTGVCYINTLQISLEKFLSLYL